MDQIFEVQGMTCGHCEKAVMAAVRAIDPQAEVQVDRQQNRVQVQSTLDRDAIAQAIRDEGYRVGS